ncbi:MAG: hypothetical protein AAGF77_00660 [Bacteroidota bacterium]
MNKIIASYLMLLAILFGGCQAEEQNVWTLFWVTPENGAIPVTQLSKGVLRGKEFNINKSGLDFTIKTTPIDASTKLEVLVNNSTQGQTREGFLSLQYSYGDNEIPYNFNGSVASSEMFRQSPHDVNAWIVKTIPMQAMPLVAVKKPLGFEIAFSDSPVHYENFTSQEFNTDKQTVFLNSGDSGASPGMQPDTSKVMDLDYNAEKTQIFTPGKVLPKYHKVTSDTPHEFTAVVLHSEAKDFKGMRKDVIQHAALHFSKKTYDDAFGALSFTTAYMNLRRNDSGKSDFWVVPAVEYANTQYGRDAFWISTMLTPNFAGECLKSELVEVNHFAEYPLFALIWAYRVWSEGFHVDNAQLQQYVDAIEERVHDHGYYSYWEGDGRLDFQYWGDVMAFEKDDLISYNQGLFALAIRMARDMGLKTEIQPEQALALYQDLFNDDMGYMPISRKKEILGPDPLVPDLLSQIYLKEKMLTDQQVTQHFNRMVKYAKTPYGFKIVATPKGEYLPPEAYDIPGYQSQVNREKMPDGRYFRGGSYFLYDNLFLLDAYLHNVAGAYETLKWRIGLDFAIGNTTYECLNTITGEPWKPNMGWNVAIYAFWKKLLADGRANEPLLEHIDALNQDYDLADQSQNESPLKEQYN